MKKKDIQDLKNRSTDQFQSLVAEAEEKLRGLKFDLAAGKVKDISVIHETRKRIARIKTFLREKTMSGNE